MIKDERSQILENNLMTSAQVCKRLGISKSSLSRVVDAGLLPVGYATSMGNLFFRDKVEEYHANQQGTKATQRPSQPIAILHKTRFDPDEFMPVLEGFGRIERIHLYYDDFDAAIDGFYQKREQRWTMTPSGGGSISCPRIVLIDKHQQQIWSKCGSIGYRGAGVSHSLRMLRWLANNTPMPAIDERLLEQLSEHRVIQFVLEETGWAVYGRDSMSQPIALDYAYQESPATRLIEHQGNLSLLQIDESMTPGQRTRQMIERYHSFIPQPVSYRYQTQAHVPVDVSTATEYPLIIRDQSGRELWLRLDHSLSQADQDRTVKELLAIAGIDVDVSELQPSVLRKWMAKLLSPFKGE